MQHLMHCIEIVSMFEHTFIVSFCVSCFYFFFFIKFNEPTQLKSKFNSIKSANSFVTNNIKKMHKIITCVKCTKPCKLRLGGERKKNAEKSLSKYDPKIFGISIDLKMQ